MKSGNTTPFKQMGSSPMKQDVKQTITTGVSKNINTPGWKTTTVTTTGLPNKGRSAITTLDKTGQVVGESGGWTSKSSSKPKTKPKHYPNNPDLTKRSYDIKVPKKSTASKVLKTGGKILKKGLKFLGGKTLGVAGMLSGKLSHADQPKGKKSEGEQIKDLLTKHKLKGGRK